MEVEAHPELVDIVLTYEDLERWLAGKHLGLKEICEEESDRFEPEEAREGAMYPVEGGILSGLGHAIEKSRVITFSGIDNVEQALKGIAEWRPERSIFLELTSCHGSCINGPKVSQSFSIARRRYDVARYAKPAPELPRRVALEISQRYTPAPIAPDQFSEMQVREALRTVGKYSPEDELNCGGCGYDSCREFAHALIAHNAERMMCATYTRLLAQKKANALLEKMPSAVVIVDDQLKIIECNMHFIRLFSENIERTKDLEGYTLDAVIPFSHLFSRVLTMDEDIVGHDIRYQRTILNASIFSIEPHSILCGVFQDITQPAFQKEQIIARAREVIQKNLNTVQQIAYLLGENAAESEITLNSIVRSFSPEDVDDCDPGAADE